MLPSLNLKITTFPVFVVACSSFFRRDLVSVQLTDVKNFTMLPSLNLKITTFPVFRPFSTISKPPAFDSYTIPEDDPELGQSRLLEVNNRVVVPAKTHLRIILTSADVLHSWAVPSSGVKCDAVPGRLNQTSISVQREGVYYDRGSRICGILSKCFIFFLALASLLIIESFFPGSILCRASCDGRLSPSEVVDIAAFRRAAPQQHPIPALAPAPAAPPAPIIPLREPPLMEDPARLRELLDSAHLHLTFRGRIETWQDFDEVVNLARRQSLVERRVQDALIEDGWSPLSVLARRREMRDIIFYNARGVMLSRATMDRYIHGINTSGTRASIPYRKVVQAILRFELLLRR